MKVVKNLTYNQHGENLTSEWSAIEMSNHIVICQSKDYKISQKAEGGVSGMGISLSQGTAL